MGISPFMAGLSGAFEGYNEILDEERETAAALKLEQAKDTVNDTLASNFFTTMGDEGPTQWFQFSDAKDEPTRNYRDLSMIAQLATPALMERLTPDERQQWETKAIGLMQNYHRNIRQYSETGELISTPSDHTFPELLSNPYTAPLWKSVLSGEYTFNKTSPNANRISVTTNDEGGVDASPVYIDYSLYGMTEGQYDEASRVFAMQRGDDPNTAHANYGKNYKHTVFLHTRVNPLNQNESMNDVFRRVANTDVVNPEDIRAINQLQNDINKNDVLKIGSYEIFKAVEFVSAKTYETQVPRSNNTEVIYKPREYLDKVLGIKPEQLREKREAAKQGQRIQQKIVEEIEAYESRYGEPPPSTGAISGVAGFFAAFTGRQGTVQQQLGWMSGSIRERYGVADEGAAGYVAEQYGVYQKALDEAEKLGDEKLIAAAKVGAVAQLYSVMLSYQLAVAIQGGTGGRTVSDQDVQNMQRAIGDKIFVNNRVQKHVLKEVGTFLQDIINATGYFTDALGSSDLRAMKAANTHHKLFFGGMKAGQDVDTGIVSDMLNDRLQGAKIVRGGDVFYTPEGNMIFTIGGEDGIRVENQSTYLDVFNDLKNSEEIKNMEASELQGYGLEGLFNQDITTEEDAKFYLESIGNAKLVGEMQ